MLNFSVFTLTRERLEYTQTCFASLQEKAGHPYKHFVVDNGSEDGTREWLHDTIYDYAAVSFQPHNLGISRASNLAIQMILERAPDTDVIVKFDNDCRVVTGNILDHLANVYGEIFDRLFEPPWVLSPRVVGINRQPSRIGTVGFAELEIGRTGIVGGLFQCIPAAVARLYRYPETLPLAHGQDDSFSSWCITNGVRLGYVEPLIVEHIETTDGQAQRYPAYFARKWREERAPD